MHEVLEIYPCYQQCKLCIHGKKWTPFWNLASPPSKKKKLVAKYVQVDVQVDVHAMYDSPFTI